MRHIIALILVFAALAPCAFAMSREEYNQRMKQAHADWDKLGDEWLKVKDLTSNDDINKLEAEEARLNAEHDLLTKEFANQMAEPMKQLTETIDKMKVLEYRMQHPTKLDYCKAFIWNMERPFKAIIRAITP